MRTTSTPGLALMLALACACAKEKPTERTAGEEAPPSLDVSTVCEQVRDNVYRAIGLELSPEDRETNLRSCTSYLEGVRAEHGEAAYRATAECTLRQSRDNPRGPFDCDPVALGAAAAK